MVRAFIFCKEVEIHGNTEIRFFQLKTKEYEKQGNRLRTSRHK